MEEPPIEQDQSIPEVDRRELIESTYRDIEQRQQIILTETIAIGKALLRIRAWVSDAEFHRFVDRTLFTLPDAKQAMAQAKMPIPKPPKS